jgi:hypothetical protein
VSGARSRTQTCGKAEARTRLAQARAFVDAAELLLDDADPSSANVAASLAVLAGVAASDAACCYALGRRPRGQDHREAIGILSGIAHGGKDIGPQDDHSRRGGRAGVRDVTRGYATPNGDESPNRSGPSLSARRLLWDRSLSTSGGGDCFGCWPASS